jgi:4-amino-4-deoxy-L-arabinose transferase-like glycosyltransferase
MKKSSLLKKVSLHKPLAVKLLFALSSLFIIYIAFYQLGKSPLENWDEAWYADVTRHMMRTKEFVILYWNQEPWLDKPPMYMWLSALVSSVIGLSEFSVRVPSAISGIVIVMLVTRFSYKQYGFVPSVLAFVTLALNNLFVWRMRSGNIDLLAALLMLLVFLAMISKNKYKYLLLGVLFSCMFLTRASLVIFPLIIFILHEVLFERKGLLKRYKEYIKLFLIAGIVPAIWLIVGSMKVGIGFAHYFLFASDRSAASVSLSHLNNNYIMYTYYALQRRFAFVFVAGVLFAIRYIKDSKVFLMLLFGVGLIIQLSFIERSNNWYLIPSMSFWSLLVAFGTYHILKLLRNNPFVLVGVLALSLFIAYRTYTINIIPILETTANEAQMQSSKRINTLTKPDDIVVRLDHLYPTTVYYTDRRIVASPEQAHRTHGSWITRVDVVNKVKKKQITWIVGKTSDITAFQATVPEVQFKTIKVNGEETILQVI